MLLADSRICLFAYLRICEFAYSRIRNNFQSMFRQANLASNTLQLNIEARMDLSDEQTRCFTPITYSFAIDRTHPYLYPLPRGQRRDDISSGRGRRDPLAPFQLWFRMLAVAVLVEQHPILFCKI